MNNLEIKEFRKKYKLTQEELAKITSVSVRTVKSWEYGERNISKIAEKLIHNYTQSTPKTEKQSNLDSLDIRKLPHAEQMQMLLNKIEDLETKVLIHQERDRLYLKSIIEHLGINDDDIDEQIENINKKSNSN